MFDLAWGFVTATIAVSGIGMAALAWLLKKIITHFLDKDVKIFQAALEARVAKEMESYKSQLEIERIRLQISYGGIFEKQASAIMELYDQLLTLEGLVNGGIKNSEEWNVYKGKLDILKEFFHRNRVLLPIEIDEKIQKVLEVGRGILSEDISFIPPEPLTTQLREIKDAALVEMRYLLAVVAKPNN